MRPAFDAFSDIVGGAACEAHEKDSPDTPDSGKRRHRAVFISDVHLRTPGFQAVALLNFLKHHTSEHLYLVGDIIDGWR